MSLVFFSFSADTAIYQKMAKLLLVEQICKDRKRSNRQTLQLSEWLWNNKPWRKRPIYTHFYIHLQIHLVFLAWHMCEKMVYEWSAKPSPSTWTTNTSQTIILTNSCITLPSNVSNGQVHIMFILMPILTFSNVAIGIATDVPSLNEKQKSIRNST